MSKPRLRPMLDQASQARLGEKLRSMYDRLPDEPMSEELSLLVGALQQPAVPQRAATERPRFEREPSGRAPQWRKPRIRAAGPVPQAASRRG